MQKQIIRLLMLISLLSLNACTALDAGKEFVTGAFDSMLGGEDNTEPPTELMDYESKIEISELWDESIGVGSDEHFLKLVATVSYGKVIVADREGLLEARDLKNGDLVWETDSDYSFSAGPGIGLEHVVLGTSHAQVVGFDLETGEQKWQSKVSSEVLAVPVIAKGIVLIRTIDGKVTALSEEDGKQLWQFERNVPALSIRGTSKPVLVHDNVIIAYANGKLVALRLIDGKEMWETSIAIPTGRSEVERLVDLDADPVETDGVIFVSSYQGGSSAVLEIDGDVLWRNEDVSSFSGMSVDWQYLYLTDSKSDVWQLDQRNGASLWKQDKLRYRRLTAPVAYEDYVIAADFEGYVHWLSKSDGSQLGRVQIADAPVEAKPLVINDRVIVYAKDGSLAVYQVKKK